MNIGDKIPEVLGVDQDGKEIKASDFAGHKLVLYTYPKDNTSGCTAEACSLRDHRDQLRALGYEVLGVSKDSQASHQKFIEKQQLNFPLIADTDTHLLQQLGAWGEKNMYGKKTMGTLRTTYLVDENGIITDIFTPKMIKTKEHAQQIIDRVKADK
ncbi:MAG: thioredoxin-dependent thiol peroxidase [Muribaculaceae bacterium]|nr:thioredoxin-dependent thiol peroxidase [Muribaculaceae bacterium]